MKYTPKKITEDKLFYTIPIYQRLFEWDTDNIVALLEDLKKEFDTTQGKGDYYIGMLTSTNDHELVDGQQRFTVMMLLGCVLKNYYSNDNGWNKFLITDNRVRVDFSSRPLDTAYMRSLIENIEHTAQSFINLKMQNGYNQIMNFMEDIKAEDRPEFAKYIFEHLCFFISNLPIGYSPKDLNKYFERMNTSGKNLEQHEILKVKLLSNLDGDYNKYMLLWNKLADVDTLLIRRKKEGEKLEDIKRLDERKNQALKSDIATIYSYNLINGLNENINDDSISINDIEMSAKAPKNERETNKDSHCAISFPHLLLQVLYRKLGEKNIHHKINDFFKPNNLLDLFDEYLPFSGDNVNTKDILDFMESLVRARLALDICFIRPTEYGYYLDMNLSEDNNDLKNLLMFQSMLFVSSSNYTNYRWFNWLLDEIKNGVPNAKSFLDSLISKTNNEFKLPEYEKLTYKGDNRYWFWRLDFYIWQHRKDLFDKDSPEINIIENYVFKRNRSIEHIAPQTPQSNSKLKWESTEYDNALRDSFGNLVMISQSLNSSLSNESYEVKYAHVQSYINGSKSGSIESLKLLVVYKDYPTEWNKNKIVEHGKRMYEWLQKAYNINTADD